MLHMLNSEHILFALSDNSHYFCLNPKHEQMIFVICSTILALYMLVLIYIYENKNE